MSGSRRRFCPACGKKWVDKVPAPRPMWVMAAMVLLAAAAAVNMIRSMDSEYRGPRSRGKSAGSGRASPAAAPSRAGTAKTAASPGASRPGAANPSSPGLPESGTPGQDEDPGLVEVDASSEEGSLLDLLGDLLEMAMNSLKGAFGGSGPSADELERMDKKMLWKKYGHYFGSKDEAKKSYDEYLNKKKSEEAAGR